MKTELTGETETLIDQLLAEQRTLTAVEKFSRQHERHDLPAQARYYRDLIPLAKPQPGQQYAFEVDLDQCSGCKACVTACHSLNGLDDEETWRNVGLLHGGTFLQPIQRTVTTACHHCVDPACLNGCPVLAYEKDSATGIVKHLDDQCIGCQYCVLKCPYDVPKYSKRLGIVRKCDMCSSRLASGEAPACVQACPNEAIRITVVEQRAIISQYAITLGPRASVLDCGSPLPFSDAPEPSQSARGLAQSKTWRFVPLPNLFLPGSPAPSYTLPTTRYKSAQPLHESLNAADAQELHPQPAHTPLAIMLVLSQLSVGAFAVERVLAMFAAGEAAKSLRPALTLTALLIGLAALATSTLHLGRPCGAWRAFLGLRRSWLSREIIVFGLFAKLAILYTAAVWFPQFAAPAIQASLGWATVASGLLGVFCSAMLYHDTRREFWHLRFSGAKFPGTTALLGSATALVVAVCVVGFSTLTAILAAILISSTAAKFAVEWPIFRHLEVEDFSPLHKTALLLHGRFGLLHRCRVACGFVGGIILPTLLALQSQAPSATDQPTSRVIAQAAAILLLCLSGELIERRLFFTTVQPVKMPGGVGA